MYGQIDMNEYLSDMQKDWEKRYPIFKYPKKTLDEEGWVDNWHYAKFEQPDCDDIYCGILLIPHYDFINGKCTKKGEDYNYTYVLWLSGRKKWFVFDGWKKRWQDINKGDEVLAWVRVPTFFRKNDKGLQARYDALEQFCITK